MTSGFTSQVKGYQLLDCIGEGAYGAVYRARQQAVDREVAVKIILPEFASRPDFIRRFESEAQLVAQLEHLHIVPLYDYWRDPEGAYLVMRLMKGGSLEESLAENGSWTPEAAARLIDQVASALGAAHQQGIVHRDLKPANILLDESGNAYLSDFGIAKELGGDSGATATGTILGTPAYLTPEQVQSQPVTPQTDIYALGILIYELLIGDHPFPDTSTGELVSMHLTQPLPYVREARPELSAAVDGVIQRATAKNPADRYSSALSLAEDFHRALALEVEPVKISESELYNPYKGLRAFQEADCDDFFGREALTGQLLAQLAAPGQAGRFLAVVGPSGSGKSSVVKAGLLPALRKCALPGSEGWFIVEMHPGLQPFNELELALLGISADPEVDLGEILGQDGNGLIRAAQTVLPGKEDEILLVIDQFEELFILVQDEQMRTHFIDNLCAAVSDPQSRLRVVLTLRADFYDRPLMYPDFAQLVEERTAIVLPFTTEELEQAIQGPAGRVGAVLEKGLVSTIIDDVADQPGSLPLLQYALTELFERREGRMLTNQAYQAIGGVLGALGRRAELVYSSLEPAEQEISRQLFLRLVTLGEGAEDTRRRVLRQELDSLPISVAERQPSPRQGDAVSLYSPMEIVIDAFGRARLLSFDRDPTTRSPTVEVAHEALLREWPRLREWLDESRADIRMGNLLTGAADQWLDGDRDPSFLLRGSRLVQFEEWSQETTLALTADEKTFLQTSLEDEAARRAQREKLERRSRNFLRALVVVFAVAAVIAIVLTIFAFNQQGIAQENALQADQNAATALAEADARATQQAIAEIEVEARATQQAIAENEAIARGEAEQQALDERDRAVEAEFEARKQAAIGLAGQALNELNGRQPDRAVPLALEAVENYPTTWQARRALGMAVLNHRLDKELLHEGAVFFMQLSKDGKRLLTSSHDGNVRVWDIESGDEILVISKVTDPYATWSADETKILILAGDTEEGWLFEIRDAPSGEMLLTQAIDSDWRTFGDSVSRTYPWSPSGNSFVTGHEDGSARIWDADSGEEILRLSGHNVPVIADWSPAGDLIMTNGIGDNLISMWDASNGEPIFTIPTASNAIAFRNWSHSGDRFTTRETGWVRIYDSRSGRELHSLETPNSSTTYAEFSPDDMQLITSGYEDGIARLWDAENGNLISMISGMTQAQSIAWAPSGQLAAVGGVDGSIRIWDITTGSVREEIPCASDVMYIVWSPENKIFVGSNLFSIVSNFKLNQALMTFSGVPGGSGESDWSPDGQYFGISLVDGSTPVWNAETGEEVYNFSSGDYFGGLSWSPSGDRILTWNSEGPLRIWDANTWELLVESPLPEVTSFKAAWSPDGSQVAGTDWNEKGKVTIWDAATLEEIRSYYMHGWASVVRWSPDGRRIATTSWSGEASIQDAATGEVLLQLFPEDYSNQVDGIAWTKDSSQVIIFSFGTGYRFDATTGEELMQYVGHTGNVFSIRWSPDEELIYTAGSDGTARVFEVTTGTELLVYEVGGWVEAALSPNGNQLFIYSGEGVGYLYPVWDTDEELIAFAKECCLIHELTPDERDQFGLPPK